MLTKLSSFTTSTIIILLILFALLIATTSLAASCPATVIINDSGLAWNAHDQKVLEDATKRCEEKYPEAPCLKKFWKKEAQTYWALCGAKE